MAKWPGRGHGHRSGEELAMRSSSSIFNADFEITNI
jgi:hypothetical protein